jgi:hypothetical protein
VGALNLCECVQFVHKNLDSKKLKYNLRLCLGLVHCSKAIYAYIVIKLPIKLN